jgi:hypothetical protein
MGTPADMDAYRGRWTIPAKKRCLPQMLAFIDVIMVVLIP